MMTRETRARLAAGSSSRQKQASHAVIRVRLPDGLILQGEFNSGEQVRDLLHFVPHVLLTPKCGVKSAVWLR